MQIGRYKHFTQIDPQTLSRYSTHSFFNEEIVITSNISTLLFLLKGLSLRNDV